MPDEHSNPQAPKRISASEPIFGLIHDFLVDEAFLLDDDRQLEWATEFLTDDIVYVSHRRLNVYRTQGEGIEYARGEFNDDKQTLILRAKRNTEVKSAFDRDPAPRICRVVSNITVHEITVDSEYRVRSRLILYRNRFDAPNYDVITASRSDVVRFTTQGPKLARREILPDMARLGALFSNVFL